MEWDVAEELDVRGDELGTAGTYKVNLSVGEGRQLVRRTERPR